MKSGFMGVVALAAVMLAGCLMRQEGPEELDANGFGPVACRATATNAFEVSVWGRTYRYRDSVFPVSVKTANREIFAAPMIWKIYEEREMDSAEFVPYWRKDVSDTKGVYASVYRDAARTTAAVSNLTSKPRRATLDFGAGVMSARDLLTGECLTVADGKVIGTFEPFRPYLIAVERTGK